MTVVKKAQVQRHSWVVRRFCTIHRETLTDGEIQYTVRVWDTGRERPFIENSFTTERQAEEFYARIRRESAEDPKFAALATGGGDDPLGA